jgi:hypothetical protein
MVEFFSGIVGAFVDSFTIQILSLLYFIVTAIGTYDVRLIQAKQKKYTADVANEAEGLMLPNWVGYIHWVGWIIFGTLLFLNWKFAIVLFILIFVLKVSPVMERFGAFLMYRFLK